MDCRPSYTVCKQLFIARNKRKRKHRNEKTKEKKMCREDSVTCRARKRWMVCSSLRLYSSSVNVSSRRLSSWWIESPELRPSKHAASSRQLLPRRSTWPGSSLAKASSRAFSALRIKFKATITSDCGVCRRSRKKISNSTS